MPPAAEYDCRLNDLPDDILHRVLSLLPAKDAVRTCVLARRWHEPHDLWKFATSLDIELEAYDPELLMAAREFVDHLLLLRQPGMPIDTCNLSLLSENEDLSNEASRFKLWIRHILKCKTRVLTIDIDRTDLDGLKLISNHLVILCFRNIIFENELLDFSSCPALKELQISFCDFGFADTISSQSLICLDISDCMRDDTESRICIDTPNLNSLHLLATERRCPLLQRMPYLVEAFVNTEWSHDRCYNSHAYGDCGDVNCDGCYEIDGDTDNCVLLQGLSDARDLVLRPYAKMFIFKRDLKFRPIFHNLRTLLLTEYWCLPDDFDPLSYMLHHSPMLEKLTLELYVESWRPNFGIKGRCNSTELSTGISRNLRIVDVKFDVTGGKIADAKCEVANERYLKVFKFLGTLGINFNLDEVEILESKKHAVA